LFRIFPEVQNHGRRSVFFLCVFCAYEQAHPAPGAGRAALVSLDRPHHDCSIKAGQHQDPLLSNGATGKPSGGGTNIMGRAPFSSKDEVAVTAIWTQPSP